MFRLFEHLRIRAACVAASGWEVNNGTGRYGSGRRSRTSGGMNRANRWRMPAEIAGMLGVLFPFSSDEPWGGNWLQRAL
ncbi:hypothetical protein CN216_30265 [Sinorhizobium meliloti]|nr:hypothetical protein CN216_30265 [Sinorhizobium meliloti]